MTDEVGTLKVGEVHPMSHDAFAYIKEFIMKDIVKTSMLIESMASCVLSGNRTAEVCGETLRRIMNGESVSDRYLLGLAWFLRTKNDD